MPLKYRYVFIIGAGGSVPYGFPTGYEFYDSIQMNYPHIIVRILEKFGMRTACNYWDEDAKQFSEQLRKTNRVSIDKYLNINKQYLEIGVHAIASDIYVKEHYSKLPFFGKKNDNDWYSYLYGKLIQDIYNPGDFKTFGQSFQ